MWRFLDLKSYFGMQNFKRDTIIIFAIILWIVLLLDVKFWPWYEENSDENYILTGAFFDNLQVISWTVFEWPNKNLYSQYNNFLDSTHEYLKLQTYDFTNKILKSELTDLAEKSIPVQIILEDNKYQQYQNTFRELHEYFSWYNSVKIRNDEQMWTQYVHSKFTLNEKWFRVQTANLTKSSFESNREHFFYSEDEDFRESLEQLFDADRNGEVLSELNLHPNLVVCPYNCREVIKTLLEKAESSIVIQTQYIVDDEILDILRRKSEEINLAMIVANTDDNQDLISYFWPWKARMLQSNYNHTKMILIDEKYLLLGSMNLSSNSLDNNREIWIILLDEKNISEFLKWFKEDWKSAL